MPRGSVFLNAADPAGERRISLVVPPDGEPKLRILRPGGEGVRDVFAPR